MSNEGKTTYVRRRQPKYCIILQEKITCYTMVIIKAIIHEKRKNKEKEKSSWLVASKATTLSSPYETELSFLYPMSVMPSSSEIHKP